MMAQHIVQVTTTSYSRHGVIGGGERIALYIDDAIVTAGQQFEIPLTTTLLALDGTSNEGHGKNHHQTMTGIAWDPYSLDCEDLIQRLLPADIVYVHQCMTPVGLLVGAHARLLGKKVYGLDAGAGEAPILNNTPSLMCIFDRLHALSRFGASAFEGMRVPVDVIPGPVDTMLHRLPLPVDPPRDQTLVACLGRVLPHKGFERAIKALPQDMTLVIIGEHYDKEYLGYLRDCAIGKKVHFKNQLDDGEVREVLRRCGTFVHASTHFNYKGVYIHKPELLGLAPLEALSSGAYTLVSDAACLPELTNVPGCEVFTSESELRDFLIQARDGKRAIVEEREMHDEVERLYGFATVGRGLLAMMGLCAS